MGRLLVETRWESWDGDRATPTEKKFGGRVWCGCSDEEGFEEASTVHRKKPKPAPWEECHHVRKLAKLMRVSEGRESIIGFMGKHRATDNISRSRLW